MQINMTTFGGRKVHYIDQTLESLFSSGWRATNAPVRLIMGSEDEHHIEAYKSHPSVRIVPWDAETNRNLRVNCTLNKLRALRCGDDGPMVICEDDIVFPPYWLPKLERASAEIDDEDYVLSLFAANDLLEGSPLVEGKQWIRQYPTDTLQGAQALFYPRKSVRLKVADFLEEYIMKGCGDELIGRYARAHAKLYATKNPLVENIGATSCFH